MQCRTTALLVSPDASRLYEVAIGQQHGARTAGSCTARNGVVYQVLVQPHDLYVVLCSRARAIAAVQDGAPHGGMHDSVFVQQIATNPRSAARQP